MLCELVVCRRLLEIVNKANANFWEFRPIDGFLSDDSDDEALWDPLDVHDAAKCMADLAAERTDSCRRCWPHMTPGGVEKGAVGTTRGGLLPFRRGVVGNLPQEFFFHDYRLVLSPTWLAFPSLFMLVLSPT